MGDGLPFLDIIFFAMVAAFLILRLRSVLGRRTGNERDRPDPFSPKPEAENDADNVVALPQRAKQAADLEDAPPGSVAAGLTQIKLADSSFEEKYFANGSRAAFEMIVEAFARGDREALRPLLANEVYDRFAGAIDSREARKETLETRLIALNAADITEARMNGPLAEVTVEFVSEQVNLTRNAAGEVIDGDPDEVETVVDIWTFRRDTRSDDPNWLLAATRTPN
ncbi:Tim44/TimA family putative adaptor protein [Oceanibaculum nanhaiense]|jgi:predicted lipid-binding transport protein (Tim44 family)|uniref:Tim44/TimA family putative adaptor protein n=1 Tax=Oceanibaculum nanhaiense TaxID=1909734 RepID=UPI0019ACACB6|nr:Tim44/TimA family putative adaptor protein [Oceanibaculum nanhaiense]MBC7134383.1 Tim44 domain-containing protein [Oceanibaculum nanhaiense]MDM7945801.1 Tim44/TimA family putative adaptor protein [Oceanibaculum nanhaiense]